MIKEAKAALEAGNAVVIGLQVSCAIFKPIYSTTIFTEHFL